ncbi:MAG: glutamate--tRNA ligase [Actinomycetota bacterium]|nr:glutamate--tRNA ligase [Actinomycetota bacterium]
MTEKVRVRFAPSPTGVLHIGGARTALHNYLFARKHKGKFILRIEDTDQSRSTEESIEAIISSMKWLGLDWDEGVEVGGSFGPYRQTERLPIYKEAAEELLAKGPAYPCFCTPAELEERRSIAQREGRPPTYDGRCRSLSKKEADKLMAGGKEFALRFAMPKEGETIVADIIRGEVSFQNAVLEDMVIVRQNGLPTYNFAAAIDDAKMEITHIIRGIDHLSNAPKQILLYRALGFKAPKFAHLPMIFGSDKKPLSKRHGSSSVEEYREAGYLPEAIINYLALLGWSLDDKTTIISANDLIENFSLERVSKRPAVFDEEKLSWMNGVYIRDLGPIELTSRLIPLWKEAGLLGDENDFGLSKLEAITTLIAERMKTLNEALDLTRFFFSDETQIGEEALDKLKGAEGLREILRAAHAKLEDLADFNSSEIEAALRAIPGELGVKPKLVFLAVRIAATGSEVSPPLFESLEILGKEISLKRLKAAEGLAS